MAIPSSISIPNLYVKSPISAGIEGLMQGYNLAQARKAQQQKQAMDERQMGLQEQITQMKMRELQEKIDAEKLRAQQAAMLFGSSMPQQEMITDQAVITEQPEQKQLTDEQKKQILAQQAYTKGDIGLTSRLMYPQEKLTALERNLIAAGYVPGTPEYQEAAKQLQTRGLLTQQTKASRYAALQAQDLIDKVDDDQLFERTAKFLGPQGSLHKAYAYTRSLTPYPDQDYSDLLAFRNQIVPALGSEIRKLLGDNPSVEQNKMIERVVDVLAHSNNMQEVKRAWETIKQVHAISSKALALDPLEAQNKLKIQTQLDEILKKKEKQSDKPITLSNQKMITASDGKQYSMEELQKIAAG